MKGRGLLNIQEEHMALWESFFYQKVIGQVGVETIVTKHKTPASKIHGVQKVHHPGNARPTWHVVHNKKYGEFQDADILQVPLVQKPQRPPQNIHEPAQREADRMR